MTQSKTSHFLYSCFSLILLLYTYSSFSSIYKFFFYLTYIMWVTESLNKLQRETQFSFFFDLYSICIHYSLSFFIFVFVIFLRFCCLTCSSNLLLLLLVFSSFFSFSFLFPLRHPSTKYLKLFLLLLLPSLSITLLTCTSCWCYEVSNQIYPNMQNRACQHMRIILYGNMSDADSHLWQLSWLNRKPRCNS
jgi:hypothetical protein